MIEKTMATGAGASAGLALSGTALTLYGVRETKALLRSVLAGSRSETIDLAAVDGCDTAGVQLLLVFRCEMLQRGLVYEFANPPAAVVEAFVRCGMHADDILSCGNGGA